MDPNELRRLRGRLNLTQEQLADLLGVTLSAASRWEQGQRRVPEPVARLLRLFIEHPQLLRKGRRPMRVCPLTKPQLREYSDEHLHYEVTNLFGAAQTAATLSQPPATMRDYALRMALIESFVIHLRNLIDFFYADQNPTPPKADDVIAEDFFDDPADWKRDRPAFSGTLERARGRANKEIAHLTTQRISGMPKGKEWEVRPLLAEMQGIFQRFAAGASGQRLGDRARQTIAGLSQGLLILDAPVTLTS